MDSKENKVIISISEYRKMLLDSGVNLVEHERISNKLINIPDENSIMLKVPKSNDLLIPTELELTQSDLDAL